MNTVDTREQLLHLLAEASEFEHNLLCCYLYAVFSLKREGAKGLSQTEAAAVGRWRDSMMSVAVEEMTHLALVANLTVALGARPHFNRPNLPVAPGYHPAGIVIELAPFDRDTLDHFIFLERPKSVTVADGAGFEQAVHYERGARPGAALMSAAEDYGTIAEFYETIRQALRAVAARLGEDALFIGPAESQVAEDVTKLHGLTAITDLESALGAIDMIVVQGEGGPAESADSHFARFSAIKKEYEELLSLDKDFRPAWPSARNPVMRPLLQTEDRVHVGHPQAAALLDVANAVYNEMLRLLGQAYGRADPAAADQRRLVLSAMQLMGVLRVVGEHLATLPASSEPTGVNAGVTFTVLRATEPLCETGSEWPLLAERLTELGKGMRAVCGGVAQLEKAAGSLEELARNFSDTKP